LEKHFPLLPIIEGGLCCGCGTCVGVCPHGALQVSGKGVYMPQVDADKCNNCGLCYEVCPGKGYPVVGWSSEMAVADTKIDLLKGPCRGFWLGHSTDAEIRSKSASGGIATGLLLHALETGVVDQVVVVRQKNGRGVVVLTDDPEEVKAAMQSKYCPVPMMEVIKEIRRKPRKIAFTATPCQMAGWTAAARRMSVLKDCLAFSIGLFCGQVQSRDSLGAIASTFGLNYSGECKFEGWRCGAYPGSVRFHAPNGLVYDKPLYKWLDIAVSHFNLERCDLCPDGGNWLADMVLGDIHAGGDDETVILCRTARAYDLLSNAEKDGAIDIRVMESELVRKCVITGITKSKLLPAIYKCKWRKEKSLPYPEFDYSKEVAGKYSQFRRFLLKLYCTIHRFTRIRWVRRFLLRHPALMEQVGHFLYRWPMTIPGWKVGRWIIRRVLRQR